MDDPPAARAKTFFVLTKLCRQQIKSVEVARLQQPPCEISETFKLITSPIQWFATDSDIFDRRKLYAGSLAWLVTLSDLIADRSYERTATDHYQ